MPTDEQWEDVKIQLQTAMERVGRKKVVGFVDEERNYYGWKYQGPGGEKPLAVAQEYESEEVRLAMFQREADLFLKRANKLGRTFTPATGAMAIDAGLRMLDGGEPPMKAVWTTGLELVACGIAQATRPPLGPDLDANKARAWLESMRALLTPDRAGSAKTDAQASGDKAEPLAGEWSIPMSKEEMRSRLQQSRRAFEAFVTEHEIRKVGSSNRLWQIRLDKMDRYTRALLETPQPLADYRPAKSQTA